MAFGLGVLGLAPDVFWRMTMSEVYAAVRGRFGDGAGEGAPMARSDLDALMQRFPDVG
jgi:uncharacterized phage protein (TIGR02216 family)